MERDVGQGDIREVLFVAFDVGIDRLGLVVEHQGDGVVLGQFAPSARFVDHGDRLVHC